MSTPTHPKDDRAHHRESTEAVRGPKGSSHSMGEDIKPGIERSQVGTYTIRQGEKPTPGGLAVELAPKTGDGDADYSGVEWSGDPAYGRPITP